MRLKRQGGLTFWRIGRLGGSIYIARKPVRTYAETLASYQPAAIGYPLSWVIRRAALLAMGSYLAGSAL